MFKKLKVWAFNRLKGNIAIHIEPIHKHGRIEYVSLSLKVVGIEVFETTRKIHKVSFIKLDI